jgi:hypothetical protein
MTTNPHGRCSLSHKAGTRDGESTIMKMDNEDVPLPEVYLFADRIKEVLEGQSRAMTGSVLVVALARFIVTFPIEVRIRTCARLGQTISALTTIY